MRHRQRNSSSRHYLTYGRVPEVSWHPKESLDCELRFLIRQPYEAVALGPANQSVSTISRRKPLGRMIEGGPLL